MSGKPSDEWENIFKNGYIIKGIVIEKELPIIFADDNEKWLQSLNKEKDFFQKNKRTRNSAESRWIRGLRKEIKEKTLSSWQMNKIKDSFPQLLKEDCQYG